MALSLLFPPSILALSSIENPGFEDDLNHWNIVQNQPNMVHISTANPAEGSKNLVCSTPTGMYYGYVYQYFSYPSSTFDWSFHIKLDPEGENGMELLRNWPGAYEVVVLIYFRIQNRTHIINIGGDGQQGRVIVEWEPDPNSWHHFQVISGSTERRICVDGDLVATIPLTRLITPDVIIAGDLGPRGMAGIFMYDGVQLTPSGSGGVCPRVPALPAATLPIAVLVVWILSQRFSLAD